jgi:PAS domain S-box-containing protein
MSRSLKNGYAKLQEEIDERNRAEEALRTSELRFRALFEQAAAGVAQIDTATGKFVEVNRRYCEIVGYTEEELMNASIESITHPDDLASELAPIGGFAEGKKREFSIEKRYLQKCGRIIWVSITISPLWMPGEDPRYNITVVLDITGRKRIESELNESHARYQQLFETAPVSTWEEDYSAVRNFLGMIKGSGVTDIRNYLENNPDLLRKIYSEIKVVRVNQAALRLFRASEESELLGPIDKIMVPETLPLFREQLIAISEGRTSFQSETVQRTFDGRRIDIILHMEVIGEPSAMNRVLVSHTDITALKRAEWSLRRSKDFIATVLNSIDASIAIIDAKNQSILGCNSSFLRERQTVEEEVVGKDRQDVICRYYSRSRSEECPVIKTRRTASRSVCEHVRHDSSGMPRNIEITTFPVKDDENRIIQIVHMAQDITLRKQAENARLREQELKRISAERQLVETELRMLQAQIEPHFLFNTLAHIISLIQTEPDSAANMLQYLTDTLRVSLLRTREETSILRHEMDLLRNFLRIQAMRLEPRLSFDFEIPDELLDLPFPPLLLQPLVENAVIHGIEPNLKGGSISITAERTGAFLRLRVIDTGRGLSNANSGGVGLANVRERLHALYGKKARLILSENIPCGTTAALEVPI